MAFSRKDIDNRVRMRAAARQNAAARLRARNATPGELSGPPRASTAISRARKTAWYKQHRAPYFGPRGPNGRGGFVREEPAPHGLAGMGTRFKASCRTAAQPP